MTEPEPKSAEHSEASAASTAASESKPENPEKPPLDEKRLAQLAKARERAAVVNRQKKEARLRARVAALDAAPSTSRKNDEATATGVEHQPIVVVEQSESDSEEFSAPGVVFVRRKRPKPKLPEKTPEELEMDRMYLRMFG